MLDPLLRPLKDRLFDPLARRAGRGLSPNAVTMLGCALGVAAGGAALVERYGIGLGLWLLNRALDALDGSLARVQGRRSDLGAYLDLVLDFLVYALIPLGLVLGRPTNDALTAAVVLLASFYVNAASWMVLSSILEKRGQGAAASGAQTGIAIPEGLIGGTETIVFYMLFFLFPDRLVPLFLAMAALVLVTVGQRMAWAMRFLGK